ncbi:NAD(P)/FAD-dependent oxidoreductase [Streptomyces sp. NPDC051561]|uniref:NAD(P)/FAD-dependent oxidoreductase n=1 Tax=Streptomyces sp. NPDC051561 TaxID=3365658 RepID=UPI0037A36430
MTSTGPIVVVGASLAGLRAAAALRTGGFTGALTLIGDEPRLPYDRPPLSKQTLTTVSGPLGTALPLADDLDIQWRLGTAAMQLDTSRRNVVLRDGTTVPYEGLLIATGAAARPWPGPVPEGVLTLRSESDAHALRAQLAPGRHAVVVGAGFLGGEIAAAARARGLHVTLLEAAAHPLQRAVGPLAGGFVGALHRAAGIDLRTHTTVTAFLSDQRGHLTAVRTSSGEELPADVAVLALGAVPATGWLTGSGIAHTGGVHCDAHLRALRPDGSVVPGVVAAGDVARVPQPLADGTPLALGHWTNATEQGEAAARTLLHPHSPPPWTGIPSFWSDLHATRIRSVGLPHLADEIHVPETDFPARRLEVAYHRKGRLIGALTIGRTSRLAAYRQQLAASPVHRGRAAG